MKKVWPYCSAALLLIAGSAATASPLQQPVTVDAKEPVSAFQAFATPVREFNSDATSSNAATLTRDTSFNQIDTKLRVAAVRLKEKIKSAEEYIKANGYNPDYCFMVDMSIPSGKKRFFVYNLKKDSVELSSLVSHGGGSYTPGCNDQLVFSNSPNSNATSLGRYKIGAPYKGTYGLSYKLYGLDSTNSNAFQRAIVLHSDQCVPDCETYPRHIYQSLGCPIVPPSFLAVLGRYINNSGKPVLLWIYD